MERDPLAKSKLLRGLLQRIDSHFGSRTVAGGKVWSRLERVDFHPLQGEAFTIYSDVRVERCP
jgi:hypothetical protein